MAGWEDEVGVSKEVVEKYLWYQGEEIVLFIKRNYGYEFQGIKILLIQLIFMDVG